MLMGAGTSMKLASSSARPDRANVGLHGRAARRFENLHCTHRDACALGQFALRQALGQTLLTQAAP